MSDSFANPWTVAHQTPLSMGFPRWEQWSGLQFPPPGNPSHPGIEPVHWHVSFYHWATKEAQTKILRFTNYERLIFFVICHFFLLKFYHVLLLLIFPLCIHIMAVFLRSLFPQLKWGNSCEFMSGNCFSRIYALFWCARQWLTCTNITCWESCLWKELVWSTSSCTFWKKGILNVLGRWYALKWVIRPIAMDGYTLSRWKLCTLSVFAYLFVSCYEFI